MDTTTAPLEAAPRAVEKPSDLTQLERQLNHKPNLPPRTDFKNLSDIPDSAAVPAPTGFEVVNDTSAADFLKSLEQKQAIAQEPDEKPVESKADSMFDVSLDDEPRATEQPKEVEKPKKKSKEDNLAELRKKAESYEIEVKSRDEKLAEYQKRLDEMQQEFERVAFEKSPAFRENFQAPYEAAKKAAEEFAVMHGEDASIVERALSLKGKERIDFIDEHFSTGAAAAGFFEELKAADKTRSALESALADHHQANAQIEDIQQERAKKVNEVVNRNFEKILSQLSERSDFFKKGDNDEANSKIEKRVEAARSILMGTASSTDMMTAPFYAVVAKEAMEENASLKAELAKYKDRVRKDAAVTPSIKRGASDVENDQIGKPRGAMESIRSYFR